MFQLSNGHRHWQERMRDRATCPINIAHRSHMGHAPENSLSGMRACIDSGKVDMIEIDVRPCADDLALFHDASLERMTGRTEHVKDLSLAALKELQLHATNETIPSLAEALRMMTVLNADRRADGKPPIQLGVDIKNPGDTLKSRYTRYAHFYPRWREQNGEARPLEQEDKGMLDALVGQLTDAFRAGLPADDVMLMGQDHDFLRAAGTELGRLGYRPRLQASVSFIVPPVKSVLGFFGPELPPFAIAPDIRTIDAHVVKLILEEVVPAAHAEELRVLPYGFKHIYSDTGEPKPKVRKLLGLGVDGVNSDKPLDAWRLIQEIAVCRDADQQVTGNRVFSR